MHTVDDYLKTCSPAQRTTFEHIRKLVKELIPDAGEKISYGVPTFTHAGTYVIYFGAFKDHMSIYPTSDGMVQAIAGLEKFRTSKGTLQFTEATPISDSLLTKVIQYRLKMIGGQS